MKDINIMFITIIGFFSIVIGILLLVLNLNMVEQYEESIHCNIGTMVYQNTEPVGCYYNGQLYDLNSNQDRTELNIYGVLGFIAVIIGLGSLIYVSISI